ncbi:cell division protein FtsX [Qipengyuania sp. DGS5-3]|uniref:cell division protein FtsX n=1 Tax=Qipengyuania sp. DGS5-3 TaxID=3349632 RepID=UPI0036D41AF6
MSGPPVLARAVERGLAPLKGKQAAQLLPKARMGGPMLWVIAIMVAMTVLAAGGGLAVTNLANSARGDLDGGVTVQIIEADPAARDAQASQALETLERLEGVTSIRLVPEEELSALVEPWLGEGSSASVVPLPALIDLRLDGPVDDARLEQLRAALRDSAPDARVDAQANWLGPVFSAFATLKWLAIVLIGLLALTSAAAVYLAARNALNANRNTIEIVHLLGGTDAQIAGIFQRSILIDSALGGAAGLALGGIMVSVMGGQFAALESGMVSGGGFTGIDWLILALIPLAAVLIALLTARLTVMRSLGKML